MDRCKSDGCKSEAAYKTTDRRIVPGRGSTSAPPPQYSQHGQRVFSKYCVKHTCDYFYEQEGCSYKKPPYDLVCAHHAKCPIEGCTQCKGQYQDPNFDQNVGVKYLRHAYCSEHKCTILQCQLRRYQAHPNGVFLPFCPQHRCSVESCKKQRVQQRNYCADHQCKVEECQLIVEDNYELCGRHIVCELRGCNQARHMLPKGKEIPVKDVKDYDIEEYSKKQYLPFCLAHGTCDANNCNGFRTPSSRFCPKHTCPERDCRTSSGDSHYCDAHRCETKGCDSPKGWKKNKKDREKFCPLHTCRKKDCLGDVAAVHLWCSKHECSKTNCIADAVAETLCLTHLKSQYTQDGKTKAKAEIEEWMRLHSRREDSVASPDGSFTRVENEAPGRNGWVQAS